MIKITTGILLISTLFACVNNDRQKKAAPAKDSLPAVTLQKTAAGSAIAAYFKITKDSVLILPFEIAVALSPKAQERLKKGNETIIVNAFFTGDPKSSAHAKLQEDGSFYVASGEKEIHYGETARFDSIRFSKKIFEQLADKDIDLGINVYSGRKTSGDNLLNCEPLFDKISHVVNKTFTLKGKLIYGDD